MNDPSIGTIATHRSLDPARERLDNISTSTTRCVFIRDLSVPALIGVYAHEYATPQPIIINLDMQVKAPANPISDRLEDVLCYARITQEIKAIIDKGHINLVETLAEHIAALCLAHPLCHSVKVTLEKPNAITDAASAGVEIMRSKPT